MPSLDASGEAFPVGTLNGPDETSSGVLGTVLVIQIHEKGSLEQVQRRAVRGSPSCKSRLKMLDVWSLEK